jgi:hypothetical protein
MKIALCIFGVYMIGSFLFMLWEIHKSPIIED